MSQNEILTFLQKRMASGQKFTAKQISFFTGLNISTTYTNIRRLRKSKEINYAWLISDKKRSRPERHYYYEEGGS